MTESRLQQELKQRKPFASPAQETILGLLRTTDVVRRAIAQAVNPQGVTMQQYNVLRILRGAGREGLATLAIADRLVEQTPGITRLVDELEKRGLLARQRCAEDRRRVLCFLTKEGLKLVNTFDKPVAERGESCLAALTQKEQRTLIKLLDRIREHLANPSGGKAP